MLNSKQKGARAEREVAKILQEHGINARRTAQYCGKTGEAADVIGLEGYHLEVKHQETTKIWDWIEQAERDHAEGTIPAVVYRKNNKQWQITLSLEDFLNNCIKLPLPFEEEE